MSENDPSIDTCKRWTVPVLQQYLRKRGLRTSGKKEELVALVYSADLMKIKPKLTPAEERKLKANQYCDKLKAPKEILVKESKMPQKRKEDYIECSDVDSQDEGFGSATNLEPPIPPSQSQPQPQVDTAPGINASALKWFNENPVLLRLLLGSLLMGMLCFFFYKKVDTLQSNIESLREKINQLENLSKENCSTLFCGTQTNSKSVKTMANIEDRIENAKYKIDDIVKSIRPIQNDFEVLGKNLTTMNVTLKKEKSELNILVETVKLEQENIRTIREDVEIVRTSADNCLSLKDNVNFKEDTIKKMNTDMENLNVGSSFIQQEHNRFSQKLQEFEAKLIEENNLLNKNSKEVAQLKVTIEQLNVTSTKLDETFIVLETVVANCSEQMDKCKETAKRMEGIIDDEIYLNSSINTLKKEVEILNTNISTINGDLIEENNLLNTNSIEVAQLKEDTKQLNVNSKKLNDSFDVLETVVANCSEQMDKCKETVERMEGIIDDQAYLNSSFKILEKEVEILNTSISTINGDLIEEINLLNANSKEVAKLKEGTNQLKVTAKKLDDSFDVLETVVANCSEQMEKYQKEYPSISKIPERVQTLNETLNILSIDIEDKWVLVQRMTVAFVITVLSMCGGLLYSRKHKIDDIEKKIRYLTENKDKPSLQYESLSIVEQIKRRQPEELGNKFCVISFSQETHNKHRRITRPSVEGRLRIKKMDEADFVVTNDKSVLKIPHCKVILVFVDHNQKDVILETPGEDEEDIKLLTVQACRKMGADVFVIYVGDEGSESLMAGCLYNPQLTTVAEHFELKQLEQRNRVITCHEKFTITQREKVAQAIA